MLHAAAESDAVPGQKRQLSGAMGKPLEGGETVDRRKFADRVHLHMDIERREAGGTIIEVGDPITELLADVVE